jgi:hypothetical protein
MNELNNKDGQEIEISMDEVEINNYIKQVIKEVKRKK